MEVKVIRNLNVMQKLENMFNNKKYSDTLFLVNEVRFHASSHLLSASSDVLDSIVDTHFQNCGDREILIGQVHHNESFLVLLKFIYGVTINLTSLDKAVVCEALCLSERYKLTDLSKELKNYLSQVDCIQIDSVVVLLNVAKKFNLNDAYKKSTRFALRYADELVKHESFINLQYDVLLDLLKSDWFGAIEIDILTSALDWHSDNMRKHPRKINNKLAAENVNVFDPQDKQDSNVGQPKSLFVETNLAEPMDLDDMIAPFNDFSTEHHEGKNNSVLEESAVVKPITYQTSSCAKMKENSNSALVEKIINQRKTIMSSKVSDEHISCTDLLKRNDSVLEEKVHVVATTTNQTDNCARLLENCDSVLEECTQINTFDQNQIGGGISDQNKSCTELTGNDEAQVSGILEHEDIIDCKSYDETTSCADLSKENNSVSEDSIPVTGNLEQENIMDDKSSNKTNSCGNLVKNPNLVLEESVQESENLEHDNIIKCKSSDKHNIDGNLLKNNNSVLEGSPQVSRNFEHENINDGKSSDETNSCGYLVKKFNLVSEESVQDSGNLEHENVMDGKSSDKHNSDGNLVKNTNLVLEESVQNSGNLEHENTIDGKSSDETNSCGNLLKNANLVSEESVLDSGNFEHQNVMDGKSSDKHNSDGNLVKNANLVLEESVENSGNLELENKIDGKSSDETNSCGNLVKNNILVLEESHEVSVNLEHQNIYSQCSENNSSFCADSLQNIDLVLEKCAEDFENVFDQNHIGDKKSDQNNSLSDLMNSYEEFASNNLEHQMIDEIRSETDSLLKSFSENVLKSLLSHIRISQISALQLLRLIKSEKYVEYREFVGEEKYFSLNRNARLMQLKSMLSLAPDQLNGLSIKTFTVKGPVFASSNNFHDLYESEEEYLLNGFKCKIGIKYTTNNFGKTSRVFIFDVPAKKQGTQKYAYELYLKCTSLMNREFPVTAVCQFKVISSHPDYPTLVLPFDNSFKLVTFRSESFVLFDTMTFSKLGVYSKDGVRTFEVIFKSISGKIF